MDARFRIRPASPADAPAVSVLERQCFADPWSAEGIAETLAAPLGCHLVAEVGGTVQGYLLARVFPPTAEIMNLAVAPPQRRRGLAGALLASALTALAARGATEVFLEVRASNSPAQGLYQAAGFRPVGLRPGYYAAPREDALVLRRELSGPA